MTMICARCHEFSFLERRAVRNANVFRSNERCGLVPCTPEDGEEAFRIGEDKIRITAGRT